MFGILHFRMWLELPWSRFADSIALVVVSLLPAYALRRAFGWRCANTLAVIAVAELSFFCGFGQVLATVILVLSATAIGGMFVNRRTVTDVALALTVGLALMAGCLGWLLPLPVHNRTTYFLLASVACLWRWRVLRDSVLVLWGSWHEAVEFAPFHAAICVLSITLALTGAWLPTMQGDDVVYHLGLPSQLQRNGFYLLDASQQIWSLAPWLGDVLQGFVQVLAGAEARGALDAMWVLAASALLGLLTHAIAHDRRTAWLAAALFASLPLVAALAAGMQTELPATALLLALALLVLRDRERESGEYVLAAGAVLAGALFALKFSHAIAALVMLIWAALRARGRTDASRLAVGLVFFLLVGGSSYFYAWHVSGNPTLPLFNDVFRSPVMPSQQLGDTRWHAGFDAFLPWSITFQTDRYLEAGPGGYGFVLVTFLGVWLFALCRREVRGLAVVASAILFLPMLPMQYARYAFPGLALLLPALAAVGMVSIGGRRFEYLMIALCVLNVAFQANAPWPVSTVARKRLLTHLGDNDVVLRRFAPERSLIAELRTLDATDSIVLAIDPRAPNVAELAGRGRSVSWYSPAFEAKGMEAEQDPSGQRWRRLIDDSRASWILLRPEHLTQAQRAALASAAAQRVDTINEAELWSWRTPSMANRDAGP
jgi:hypothetical protein